MNIFEQLSAPFPPAQVHWRVGSTNQDKTKGLALAYLDARDVMERLDTVVGPANWQNRYPHANGKTVCEIGINVHAGLIQVGADNVARHLYEWVWKADGSGDTDVEAEKGALSDAFKRAAVRWGIGQYLYSLGNVWVEIEPMGRSYKIKESEKAKLARSLPNAPVQPAPVASPSPDQQKNFDQLKTLFEGCETLAEIDDKLRRFADMIAKLTEEQKERLRGVVRFVREARKVAA